MGSYAPVQLPPWLTSMCKISLDFQFNDFRKKCFFIHEKIWYVVWLGAWELLCSGLSWIPDLPPRHLPFPLYLPCLQLCCEPCWPEEKFGSLFGKMFIGEHFSSILWFLAVPPDFSPCQENLTTWVERMSLKLCQMDLSHFELNAICLSPLNTTHHSFTP